LQREKKVDSEKKVVKNKLNEKKKKKKNKKKKNGGFWVRGFKKLAGVCSFCRKVNYFTLLALPVLYDRSKPLSSPAHNSLLFLFCAEYPPNAFH
jgi:uncharacterized membrane protein